MAQFHLSPIPLSAGEEAVAAFAQAQLISLLESRSDSEAPLPLQLWLFNGARIRLLRAERL